MLNREETKGNNQTDTVDSEAGDLQKEKETVETTQNQRQSSNPEHNDTEKEQTKTAEEERVKETDRVEETIVCEEEENVLVTELIPTAKDDAELASLQHEKKLAHQICKSFAKRFLADVMVFPEVMHFTSDPHPNSFDSMLKAALVEEYDMKLNEDEYKHYLHGHQKDWIRACNQVRSDIVKQCRLRFFGKYRHHMCLNSSLLQLIYSVNLYQ